MADAYRPAPDDFVLPFQIESSRAKGRLVRIGPALTSILGQHAYPDPVSQLLGEALTLTAMLGAALKIDDGKFILQTSSDGPVSFLVAQYNAPGSMRGYASFDADAAAVLGDAATPDAALLGKGHLAMTIDPGPDMERYQGIVALEGGTLTDAADLYFRQSEQIPTFIKIAVARHYEGGKNGGGTWSWRAGGLMVQKLTEEGGVERDDAPGRNGHEDDDAWNRARILAATVEDHELLDPTLAPERLLYRLFHEEQVRAYRSVPLVAFCQCSPERVEQMLSRFSPEEIADMAQEDGSIGVTCEFCNRHYDFEASQFLQDVTPH